MKYLLASLLLFLFSHYADGQVSGKVTEAGGAPVPFASVALFKNTDTVMFKRTLTDEKGQFKFDYPGRGKFFLLVAMMGYQTLNTSIFELSDSLTNKDFGTLIIIPASTQLGEVVIRGDKPFVQQQTSGLVVNVQNSIMTKGSSALQVLERSPGVVIDPRNNSIALNGKSGVMVMMDGKLMRMSMAQVVALLSGMSADNIEKIELLNTPPAKYDADGNAGLINIVTKKNKKPGTNGSFTITGGYGKGEKASAAINLSHNTENTDFYGSYAYSHERTYGELLGQGSEIAGAIGGHAIFDYDGIATPVYNSHNAIAGFDSKLKSKITIGGSINYTNGTSYSHNANSTAYTLKPDSVLLSNSHINGVSYYQNIVSSFYVEKEISKGEKINFDVDYIYYKNNNPTEVQNSFVDNHGNQVGQNDSLYAPRQRDLANTVIKVGVAKVDYSKQLSTTIKLEAGAKGTYTRSTSSSGIENLVNGEWVSSIATSSNLETKEVIGAAYTTLNILIDSLTNISAGARYEYSNNTTNNAISTAYNIDRKLGELFPAIFITRKLTDNSELQLSYSKRINRPSYSDLASYIIYNDPVSVFTGNPELKPTITNNLKLGYNYHNYLFSLLFSRDDNQIVQGQVTTGPSKQIVYISPENVTYQNNITLQVTLPFKINDWWNMNYNFTGGWRQFKLDYSALNVEKSYWGYSVNFNESFLLPKSYSLELSGYYNSSNYYGASRTNGMGTINAGIKKELKNNKGSFQLSITDILRSEIYNSYIGTLGNDAFFTKAHINYNGESTKVPIIKLTYFRSFGSSTNKNERKRDTGSKDERDRI